MGTRAPSIHQIGVSGVVLDDDKKQMESVDFNLSVDYSGGIGIAIDVALAYGKSAFLSAKGNFLLLGLFFKIRHVDNNNPLDSIYQFQFHG